ncbi:hypothetical protein LTR08_005535 [Meristemomyces frigidus]|nr:hypothetical protein LTR08_005535 [Meristemomyces frigidus]
MADDTRQPPPSADTPINRDTLTVNPENKPFTGTQWQGGKQLPATTPPPNANLLAGGTENTAGGKAPDVTVGNAFKDGVKWDDFTQLRKRPCVRDALLTGIGSGFALGGARAIYGAAIWSSCTWAVGSFCFGAPAMYQYCLYKRQAEKQGMMRAVEILNKKDIEKRAREARKEKVREERRKNKDVELDGQLAALGEKQSASGGGDGRPWWKVW